MLNTIRNTLMPYFPICINLYDKLSRAKLFLNLINGALDNPNSPDFKLLKEKAQLLFIHKDLYSLYKYSHRGNKLFYFHQVIDMKKFYNLNYLREKSIYTTCLVNLLSNAAQKLQLINNIIKTGHYMNFIRNTRLKSILFCQNNILLNHLINIDAFKKFHVTFNAMLIIAKKELDLACCFEPANSYFNGCKDKAISAFLLVMKAIFHRYLEHIGSPIKLDELSKKAAKKLLKYFTKNFAMEFANHISQIILGNFIGLFAVKLQAICKISLKPKVSDLDKFQPAREDIIPITNQLSDHFFYNYIKKALPNY